MDIEIGFI